MLKRRKIKVGIAGLGRSGWDIHARLLKEVKSKYTITAVFDKDPDRRDEVKSVLGCRSYSTYNRLLADNDVELMVVAMPSHLHAKYSIQAMTAGKHVVCEKPMATSLKDADDMIKCSKKKNRYLAIFQNRRYEHAFLAVRKVINSGVLGRIIHVRMAYHNFSRRWDWQTLKKYGGGTLNNTGPHAIDQALAIFGEKDPEVFCLRDKVLTLGDADDHIKVVMYKKNLPTVEVEITSACAYPQNTWLVMGNRGTLSGTHKFLTWKYVNSKKFPKRVLDETPTSDRSYNSEKLSFTEKTWSLENDKGVGEKGFYLDLYKTICDSKSMVITPESVRRQMLVLEQCRKMAPV